MQQMRFILLYIRIELMLAILTEFIAEDIKKAKCIQF